jgi:hypothetical protein
MDPKKQGEIALIVFKAHLRKEGIPTFLSKDFDEYVKKLAEETNLPARELKEFLGIVLKELWRELFI